MVVFTPGSVYARPCAPTEHERKFFKLCVLGVGRWGEGGGGVKDFLIIFHAKHFLLLFFFTNYGSCVITSFMAAHIKVY